jgi:hypothetical protein
MLTREFDSINYRRNGGEDRRNGVEDRRIGGWEEKKKEKGIPTYAAVYLFFFRGVEILLHEVGRNKISL